MLKIKIALLPSILITLLQSCNSIEPPPDNVTISLSLADAGSIEAWIKLTTTNLQFPATVTLNKNNAVGQNIILSDADTLLYIDSLLPNTTYSFQASSNQLQVSSNQIQVTTMDTTSHNFTWQSWTFGEHSSSTLYDVAIINENNIWAVGEIYLNDSLVQPDPHAYNVVHWDGIEWTIKRIAFTRGCHAVVYPPIRSIWSFSDNDIWFASGGSLVHFDGNDYFNDCRMNSFLTGSINKIWGSSSNDLYIVGNNGNIAHYNGSSWHKRYSGTDSNINDIWGIIDDNTGESFILAAVSNVAASGDIELLQIESNGVKIFPWVQDRWVVSLWFNDIYKLFASGSGVHISNKYNEWIRQESLPPKFSESISGQANNDVFVVGDFSLVSHYNGQNWKVFDNTTSGRYIVNSYKNGVMIAVGDIGSKAIVLKMKPL